LRGAELYDHAVALLRLPKRAVIASEWSGKPRRGAIRFAAALVADEVVLRGLNLRLECNAAWADQNVSVSLLLDVDDTLIRPIARVDWRDRPHVNRHPLAGPHVNLDAGPTHYHDPSLCADPSRMLEYLHPDNNLPAARPIPDPSSFRELMEAASVLLNIQNLPQVPEPPWPSTPRLL
jgi:hypothetical protein